MEDHRDIRAEDGIPVLYGVGLGPGDPELVTLKAIKTLYRCRAIFLPDGGGQGGGRAYRILQALDPSLLTKVIRLPLPMGRSGPEIWRSLAREVVAGLLSNSPCAFAVEGDPTLYGSFIRLRREILDQCDRVRVEVISGIPSFCAAAARLGVSLASGRESLAILAGPLDGRELEGSFQAHDTLVLLKANTCLRSLEEFQRTHAEEAEVWLVEDCGFPSERISRMKEGGTGEWGYFTLAIVEKGKSGKRDEEGRHERRQ